MLEAIEGKVFEPKFFLEMVLGVIEGQNREGYFPGSIFDPPAIDPTAHPTKYKTLCNIPKPVFP